MEAVADTMSNYLSIYNFKDKSLIKYDITNSDLPTWHYMKIIGLNIKIICDSINKYVAVDKNNEVWIKTSESLLKFNPEGGSKVFDVPDYNIGNVYYTLYQMEYISSSNELVFHNYDHSKIWYFDISSEKWDSLQIKNSNINGNLLRIKKLYDETICASDDLGYLYRYRGKGVFEPINLNLFGKFNANTPINDFCLGGDGKFYLGTDIGLFVNDNFTDVQENETEITEQFSISPNPASDYINVDVSFLRMQESMRIFDVFGNCVQTVETRHALSLQHIDISALPAGVYFLSIGDEKPMKFMVVR
jgi:hypothetical protein